MSTSALLETCSDCELIERSSRSRDDDAFRALVERHGPMVQGVCERILGRKGLAEDASQATFVLLARHAGQLQVGTRSVAPWLHRVARNAAVHALRSERALKRRERTIAEKRDEMATTANSTAWQAAVPLLDEEIQRLPEPFRIVLILHYLQDRTQQDVADELGLSYGTLRRKLDEAKHLLRKRLMKRGVAVSTALLAQLLWDAGASASVPPINWSASAILTPQGTATQHLPGAIQDLVNHGTRALGRRQRLRLLMRAASAGASLCMVGAAVFRMGPTNPLAIRPRAGDANRPVAINRDKGTAKPENQAEAPPLAPRETFAPNPVQNGTRAPSPIEVNVFRGEITVDGRNQAFDRREAFENAIRQSNPVGPQALPVIPDDRKAPVEEPADDAHEFHVAELIVNGKIQRFRTLREYEQARQRLIHPTQP